jgi:ER membrane protein complex subunit 1
VHVEARGQYPILIWADKTFKTLKVNVLGNKAVTSFPILNESARDLTSAIVLHSANDISAPPQVIVEYRSKLAHWGIVLHVEPGTSAGSVADPSKAKLKKAYDVARLAGQGTIAPSLTDGKLFFTRIAKGVFMVLASAENEIIENNLMQDFGAPGILDYPDAILSVGEISPRPGGKTYAVRTVTLLATGDLVLISNGPGAWTRHEGLAYIVSADFADLPKKQTLAQQLAIEDHASTVSAYIHRLKRHINELKQLPKFLEELPAKTIASITGTASDKNTKYDLFGFHKYVIVLTKQKRIIALDTTNHGKVVWNNHVYGWKSDNTPQMTISPLGVVRVKSGEDHSVFNITTGHSLRKFSQEEPELTPKSSSETTVKYTVEENQLVGRLEDSTSSLWTFKPRGDEEIVSLTTRPEVDPVASIGDVLGDRRVIYKYLNPNVVLVTAVSSGKHTASFYLLDGVSGNTLHATTHQNIDTTQPIPTVLSENWFAYSFTIFPSSTSPSRGYQLVMSKLYESSLPDDRGPLGSAGNFSSLNSDSGKALAPYVLSHTFHVPEPIGHLAVTLTRQGITTRQLLAVLPRAGALVAIPLAALDPRRPIGRDPNKNELEEGLFKYAPTLDFDPKWFVTHRREVLGLQHVKAAAATLESTSLLFAWGAGGDVFGTRVAPSFAFDVLGKDFNRVQMLITVAALTVAVLVIAPIIARKGNNMRWEIL